LSDLKTTAGVTLPRPLAQQDFRSHQDSSNAERITHCQSSTVKSGRDLVTGSFFSKDIYFVPHGCGLLTPQRCGLRSPQKIGIRLRESASPRHDKLGLHKLGDRPVHRVGREADLASDRVSGRVAALAVPVVELERRRARSRRATRRPTARAAPGRGSRAGLRLDVWARSGHRHPAESEP
jgi:hypothetical protein